MPGRVPPIAQNGGSTPTGQNGRNTPTMAERWLAWLGVLTSKAWFYLVLGAVATLAFVAFLIAGYDLFRSTAIDLDKSGPASEWAGALFTALSTLVLAYQLRTIGLAAERRRVQSLDLVQPTGRLSVWSRNSSQQGWLLTVAVRNESDEHLVTPELGLAWYGRPMPREWLIGAPDEHQDVRNGAAELCVTVSSVKISSVDHPVLLIHIPQKACAEMDEVVSALTVSFQWSTAAGRVGSMSVPLMSARSASRSGVR